MAAGDIEASVRRILTELFPDRDVAALADDDDLATALSLDSMALIDVALQVERELGLHIPDEDLGKLTSVRAAADYVAEHLTSAG